MYRLVKMLRLFRMLKIVKERHKIAKYLNEILKIKMGLERIFFFAMVCGLLCHIVACFWVMLAQIEDSPDGWIFKNGF